MHSEYLYHAGCDRSSALLVGSFYVSPIEYRQQPSAIDSRGIDPGDRLPVSEAGGRLLDTFAPDHDLIDRQGTGHAVEAVDWELDPFPLVARRNRLSFRTECRSGQLADAIVNPLHYLIEICVAKQVALRVISQRHFSGVEVDILDRKSVV